MRDEHDGEDRIDMSGADAAEHREVCARLGKTGMKTLADQTARALFGGVAASLRACGAEPGFRPETIAVSYTCVSMEQAEHLERAVISLAEHPLHGDHPPVVMRSHGTVTVALTGLS